MVEMKLNRPSKPVSDRTMSRVLRLGIMALAIGVLSAGYVIFQDQHVSAQPSLIERQTESAEAAIRKAPGDIGARLALAKIYQSGKRPDDALKQYDEVLKVDGSHRAALLGRGSVLIAKGDLKGAAVTYRKITGKAVKGEFAAQDPQLAEAHYFLGSIAVTQGKTKEAVTELEAALAIDRSDSDALYLLGVAKLQAGEPQLAVQVLRQALRFVPTGWCEPYTQLVKGYGQLGQAPQAAYAAAMVDFCQKRPADATRKLKALIAGPMKVDALMGLGLVAETASNRPEAIVWYKKALAADPANIGAISTLSRLGVGPSVAPSKPSKAKASTTKPRTH